MEDQKILAMLELLSKNCYRLEINFNYNGEWHVNRLVPGKLSSTYYYYGTNLVDLLEKACNEIT